MHPVRPDPALILADLREFEVEAMHTHAAYAQECFHLMTEFAVESEIDLL